MDDEYDDEYAECESCGEEYNPADAGLECDCGGTIELMSDAY